MDGFFIIRTVNHISLLRSLRGNVTWYIDVLLR